MTETAPDLAPVEGRTWRRACSADQVPDDEGLVLATVPKTALFVVDDEFFCIDDTCTHEDYSLAEGWVEGCQVECSLHMAKFDLRTGAATPPASVPVAVHPATTVEGDVYVALPNSYFTKEINDGLA